MKIFAHMGIGELWRVRMGSYVSGQSRNFMKYFDEPVVAFVCYETYALIVQKTARGWVAYELHQDGYGYYRTTILDLDEACKKLRQPYFKGLSEEDEKEIKNYLVLSSLR